MSGPHPKPCKPDSLRLEPEHGCTRTRILCTQVYTPVFEYTLSAYAYVTCILTRLYICIHIQTYMHSTCIAQVILIQPRLRTTPQTLVLKSVCTLESPSKKFQTSGHIPNQLDHKLEGSGLGMNISVFSGSRGDCNMQTSSGCTAQTPSSGRAGTAFAVFTVTLLQHPP